MASEDETDRMLQISAVMINLGWNPTPEEVSRAQQRIDAIRGWSDSEPVYDKNGKPSHP